MMWVWDRHLAALLLAVLDTVVLVAWLCGAWFVDVWAVFAPFNIGWPLAWVPVAVLALLGCVGLALLARMPRQQRLRSSPAMVLSWASIFALLPVSVYVLLASTFLIAGGFDA